MALRITATIDGVVEVDRLLDGLEARVTNVAPAWPAVVDAFQAIEREAFATEGASTGSPWHPLAPSTQRQRARAGFGAAHPILTRTGTLQRQLTIGEGVAIRTTATSLVYQLPPESPYPFHQSLAPRRRLPRRAIVQFTADHRHALIRPIRNYITGRTDGEVGA